MAKPNVSEKASSKRSVPAGPVLVIVDRIVPRSNVVSIASSTVQRGPELVPAPSLKRLMGRKGRQALARRRAVDGAFFAAAAAVVALLWWSTV